VVDGLDHGLQPGDALAEQLPLRPQVLPRVGVAIEQRGNLVQRKTKLAIDQQLPQPLEIAGVISAITGLRPFAWRQQSDFVVVMKGAPSRA
jgi:hypothetical protein